MVRLKTGEFAADVSVEVLRLNFQDRRFSSTRIFGPFVRARQIISGENSFRWSFAGLNIAEALSRIYCAKRATSYRQRGDSLENRKGHNPGARKEI